MCTLDKKPLGSALLLEEAVKPGQEKHRKGKDKQAHRLALATNLGSGPSPENIFAL
jgi:hypothetical protein